MAHDLAATRAALWQRALPEERLLFACLHSQLDASARTRLLSCSAAVSSWEQVLRVAVKHQVAPLVLHALGQAEALSQVPDAIRASLHHEMLRNVAAKAIMRRTLLAALTEFAHEGVDVIAVKGTSLDLRLRDPALTVSGDIDLLLRQAWEDVDPRVHARVAALNAGTPVVDVDFERHPDLIMNGVLPVDFAAIWAGATRGVLDGAPLFTMRVEHELLCACINSARKRFFRLKSLFELAELLRLHRGLDWDEIARSARAWRCTGVAFVALTASAATADAPVVPDLARRLGLSRTRVRLFVALIERMSFSRLERLHGGLRVGGKRIGRGLLLVHASLGVTGALRASTRALVQMGGRQRRRGQG